MTKEHKVFKTKTGYCHILPDKIVLAREGLIGSLAEAHVGNNIARPLITYGVFATLLAYWSYNNYKDAEYIMAGYLGLLAVILVYVILISLKNSAQPIIERKQIQKIVFKPAFRGLTRARFEILFRDKNGKMKKRLIMLPGSLNGGKAGTDKALIIMQEENLI
ncbi:phosphoribosylaminoimidazolesuccinocarboxamide synthase [Hymenobacter crusticola]|uniref:Phosphoribosylaminoimidazolesuccinocarboxamide synthase n=1 Tax=Hymenobacter crusticola TaxID=1770526 RepID=A0A243WCG2_9BACT|nr:phosphoribosylaminoimidazolesuccinocarboxamide synthase [Hymenobacter crusticola]